MRFANPEAFWLLLLIPAYFGWWMLRRPRPRGLPFPALSLFEGIRRPRPWLTGLATLCHLLCVVALVLALARPQQGHEFTSTSQKGIDIMLVVDISASMLAEDFRPNRVEAAKTVIKSFISRQQGNRLGVVVFSGKSFTLIPLTTDYGLVADSVSTIQPQMISRSGTAIGAALVNAIYRLRKQTTHSKVIVLLTDGDNTDLRNPPLAAAQIAKQLNIRIHTIGVGGSRAVPVPVTDRFGRRVYLRNTDGSLYLSSMKETELRQISQMTHGLFFRADNENTLTAIYDQINQMEKTEFETRKHTVYSEKMHWFLIPGLLLLLLSLLLRWSRGQVLEAAQS